MTRTYNPILERTDVAGRWFGSSVTDPELGTAHVLIRKAAEPVVVWHGQPLPAGKFGEHRRYVIDVANHGIAFRLKAASADPVFPFAVAVELVCRVRNPITIARDNIQDMTAALMPSLAREIRNTAARFEMLRPTEAATAIEARLSSAHPSPDVELGGYSVTVEPMDTQGVVVAKQELGVQELRRKELKEVSHGSLEERLAQILATNNGDVREVLAFLSNERDAEAEIKLKALQIAMGGNLEDMDMADVHRNAFGNLFGGNVTGSGGQETMRERLERKTKGALENGRVVEGNVPVTATADKAESAPAPADKPAPGDSEKGANGAAPATGP
ncbi:MAG TPA: hypothetical protein VNP92_02110 [Actinophytocola sp.]|nr:hypothetical protein [Actinophytocola sp.]